MIAMTSVLFTWAVPARQQGARCRFFVTAPPPLPAPSLLLLLLLRLLLLLDTMFTLATLSFAPGWRPSGPRRATAPTCCAPKPAAAAVAAAPTPAMANAKAELLRLALLSGRGAWARPAESERTAALVEELEASCSEQPAQLTDGFRSFGRTLQAEHTIVAAVAPAVEDTAGDRLHDENGTRVAWPALRRGRRAITL